jgi:hypothetical protein
MLRRMRQRPAPRSARGADIRPQALEPGQLVHSRHPHVGEEAV